MGRRVSLCLFLGYAVASLGTAGMPTSVFTISGPGKVYLTVRDRQLALDEGPRHVEDDGQPTAARWYVWSTQIKSSIDAGYVTYDPKAEDGKVFLAPKPTPGAEWNITVPMAKESDEGKRAVIQAATGPMKSWYLGFETTEEKREDGRLVTVHRLVLAREPKQKLLAARNWLHR